MGNRTVVPVVKAVVKSEPSVEMGTFQVAADGVKDTIAMLAEDWGLPKFTKYEAVQDINKKWKLEEADYNAKKEGKNKYDLQVDVGYDEPIRFEVEERLLPIFNGTQDSVYDTGMIYFLKNKDRVYK